MEILFSLNFKEKIKKYYRDLFPADLLFNWLNYCEKKVKGMETSSDKTREICFTVEGEVFQRYKSFRTSNDFKLSLIEQFPTKIDIGPLYDYDPEMRQSYHSNIKPMERELVFDIDISDYDEVRFCCTGSNICIFCWPIISCAVRIIDQSLRQDFGFKNILWVYSGRRGVHCWVCDHRARVLTDEQRAAVVGYFSMPDFKEDQSTQKHGKRTFSNFHPFLEKSVELVTEYFNLHLLPKQGLLDSKLKCKRILNMLPSEAHSYINQLLSELEEISDKTLTGKNVSIARWEHIQYFFNGPSVKISDQWIWKYFSDKVMLIHAFPRIDSGVTIHINHLLKAPFCIHPKTEQVCVPIESSLVDDFNPNTVPKIDDLLHEPTDSKNPYRISYATCVKIFSNFLNEIHKWEPATENHETD